MTAPAQPRPVPTPGDLARRAATAKPTPPRPTAAGLRALSSTVAASIAPGQLKPQEIMRQLYVQGMRISRLRPETRLVALTLLGYANWRHGLLNKHAPTIAQLAYATGLTDGQVRVQLAILTQRGWLTERTLSTGPRAGQRVPQLCIPQLALTRIRNGEAHLG
ncbi:hypothetical protein [Streptomyces sp. EKS3.2]|uniref:hypothetical protein n=1 Tax=Streptomyces sp. EKS3.2 TaxID=3461008 RepID=UPI0040422837